MTAVLPISRLTLFTSFISISSLGTTQVTNSCINGEQKACYLMNQVGTEMSTLVQDSQCWLRCMHSILSQIQLWWGDIMISSLIDDDKSSCIFLFLFLSGFSVCSSTKERGAEGSREEGNGCLTDIILEVCSFHLTVSCAFCSWKIYLESGFAPYLPWHLPPCASNWLLS